MKRILTLLAFSLVLFYGASSGQTTSGDSFAKGDSLQKYYPLDSIQEIALHNLKGDHTLSGSKVKTLTALLKQYVFDGNYAKTKPGHIWGTIYFLSGTPLSFYSNNSDEIIISHHGDKTFLSKSKLNFDNY